METELDTGSIKSINSFYNYTVHSFKCPLLPYAGLLCNDSKISRFRVVCIETIYA